jgi:hypothetical protein
MDQSKTPRTHLGSRRYLTLCRGVLDSSIIQGAFSVAPCQTLVSRFATFFVAVPGRAWLEAAKGGALGTLAAMLRANGSLLTYTQQVRRGRLQLCGAPIHIDCLSHSRKTKRVVVASMLFAAHHG